MSKALTVLKVFFSLVSINSTQDPPLTRVERVYVGQAFRISFLEYFEDVIKGDQNELQFEMNINNNWMKFDNRPEKIEVYGFPLKGNAHNFDYNIKVKNSTEALLHEITLKLLVGENGFRDALNFTDKYSHEVILKTGIEFNYHRFMTRVDLRIDFVRKLADYCFNKEPNSVWIKDFDKGTKELTVVFVNIGYYPCHKETYRELRSRLVDKNSKIQEEFQRALTGKFPIESVQFRFFGACDKNLLEPEDNSFSWGILKHFAPLAIIFAVVGIPVTISILVKRHIRRNKRPAQEERLPRTLRRRNEDGTECTSHTVHFNNRYPSMLSPSNNSREENVGDEEKVHNGKAKIANGSLGGGHLTVPNAHLSRPKQGASATNAGKNKKNPFKFASNEERAKFDVRAMWDDDDDDDEEPLEIPTYYTYRNTDEGETSMFDAVLDMNLSDIAENISARLKGVKSMLNIQEDTTSQHHQPTHQSTNSGPSLSSRLKGLGKSMLNVSLTTNGPDVTAGPSSGGSATPSLSSKLRDFGKSMLNISIGTENEKMDAKTGWEVEEDSYEDSYEESYSYYNPRECDDAKSKQHVYSSAWEGYADHTRARDCCEVRHGYEDSRQGYDEARPGYDGEERYYDSNAKQSFDFVKDGRSEMGFVRNFNRRLSSTSGNTSEYELAQYNFPVRYDVSTAKYQHTKKDFLESNSCATRPSSREDDFDEYPPSLFETSSETSLANEQEKSIFDTDYDLASTDNRPSVTKPVPIWNHNSISKAREGLNDVKYHDYINPHQYSNGPRHVSTRSKSSCNIQGNSSVSSQSTLDFWDDDEFGGNTGWKQSSDMKSSFLATIANSVPDLRRGVRKTNGTIPQKKNQQGNSLLSNVKSSLSGEKPPVVFTLGDSDQEEEEVPQKTQQKQQLPERKSSLVGMIKTGVSSILEPDSSVSKWFSGFQNSDNPVT